MSTLPTDTQYKAAEFIETYTGRKFNPRNPRPIDISVIDIAHALSNQCRYSGHTAWHYSVAQHCVLLSDYAERVLKAPPVECLQILMHDAPEAYLVDIPRPVKQYMPEFRQWDFHIDTAIRVWLGVADRDRPAFQDELDSRMIADERAQLMSKSGNDWGHDREPLGITIERWAPDYTERAFLTHFAKYSYETYGEHQYLTEGWGVPMRATYTDASVVHEVQDLIEVDIRGGVGKLRLRDDQGRMVRDPAAGSFPRPAWRWMHGNFTLTQKVQHDVAR